MAGTIDGGSPLRFLCSHQEANEVDYLREHRHHHAGASHLHDNHVGVLGSHIIHDERHAGCAGGACDEHAFLAPAVKQALL